MPATLPHQQAPAQIPFMRPPPRPPTALPLPPFAGFTSTAAAVWPLESSNAQSLSAGTAVTTAAADMRWPWESTTAPSLSAGAAVTAADTSLPLAEAKPATGRLLLPGLTTEQQQLLQRAQQARAAKKAAQPAFVRIGGTAPAPNRERKPDHSLLVHSTQAPGGQPATCVAKPFLGGALQVLEEAGVPPRPKLQNAVPDVISLLSSEEDEPAPPTCPLGNPLAIGSQTDVARWDEVVVPLSQSSAEERKTDGAALSNADSWADGPQADAHHLEPANSKRELAHHSSGLCIGTTVAGDLIADPELLREETGKAPAAAVEDVETPRGSLFASGDAELDDGAAGAAEGTSNVDLDDMMRTIDAALDEAEPASGGSDVVAEPSQLDDSENDQHVGIGVLANSQSIHGPASPTASAQEAEVWDDDEQPEPPRSSAADKRAKARTQQPVKPERLAGRGRATIHRSASPLRPAQLPRESAVGAGHRQPFVGGTSRHRREPAVADEEQPLGSTQEFGERTLLSPRQRKRKRKEAAISALDKPGPKLQALLSPLKKGKGAAPQPAGDVDTLQLLLA